VCFDEVGRRFVGETVVNFINKMLMKLTPDGTFELFAINLMKLTPVGQFHQHFTSSFLPIFFRQNKS